VNGQQRDSSLPAPTRFANHLDLGDITDLRKRMSGVI